MNYWWQYYEGKIAEMEEERAAAVQQAVDESVSLKLRKLQVRLENMEKESRDLREVHFSLCFWIERSISELEGRGQFGGCGFLSLHVMVIMLLVRLSWSLVVHEILKFCYHKLYYLNHPSPDTVFFIDYWPISSISTLGRVHFQEYNLLLVIYGLVYLDSAGAWPLQLNKCLIENQKVYQQRIKEFEERFVFSSLRGLLTISQIVDALSL